MATRTMGNVARDPVGPQAGLALAVLCDVLARRSAGGDWDTADGLPVAESGALRRAGCARKRSSSWAEAQAKSIARSIAWGSPYLLISSRTCSASCAGGQNQRNLDTLAGAKGQTPAQAEDRVQDKTLAVAGLLQSPHRTGEGTAAADETAPVGFEPQVFILTPLQR